MTQELMIGLGRVLCIAGSGAHCRNRQGSTSKIVSNWLLKTITSGSGEQTNSLIYWGFDIQQLNRIEGFSKTLSYFFYY